MSALIATDLGKAYRRYQKPIDSLKELFFRRQYHEQFWAIRGASFRCESGEVLGVVGDNGAGKSSLLKLLAGTMQPTQGELIVNGRVSAILELGSGFHPDFTGLENIHLGCAVLGLSAEEIAARVDEIIEFSELADFINQPVKTYSSGMFVRLAFSVVTSVDPDILVIDEALSVGDQHFQKKSIDRMMAFKEQGKALVFCSHSLYQVKELCERVIWLDRGEVKQYGPAADVIEAYKDHIRLQNNMSEVVAEKKSAEVKANQQHKLVATLVQADFLGLTKNSQGMVEFKTQDRFAIQVLAEISPSLSIEDVHIGIVIKRNDGVECYGTSTMMEGVRLFHQQGHVYGVIYEMDKLLLMSGQYVLDIWLIDSSASVYVYDSMLNCCSFSVQHESSEVGIVFLQHQWKPCQ